MGTQLPPPKKRYSPPHPILGPLWPNGWMDQGALGTEVGLGPGDVVLDGDPAPLPKKVTAPSFRPMSIVAMVAHLSYC